MNLSVFLLLVKITFLYASRCGCKTVRPCYEEMLQSLMDHDEADCIENASIGTSTLIVFFQALKKFCGIYINVINENLTYEGRRLYEVVLSSRKDDDTIPVILIEAGQQAGTSPVGLALFIIEQLLACQEYNEMIERVRWVILPCSNPDGQEYSRFDRPEWKKNVRLSDDSKTIGVDISRNFNNQWGSCDKVVSGFSPEFPGLAPASENETIFIKDVITKHKKSIAAYLSLRRGGHSIMYPYAWTKNNPSLDSKIVKIAGEIAAKVNQRASGAGVQLFQNQSIYDTNGKPHCGHSVDYAYNQNIALAFEMRVFLAGDLSILSKFQTLPRGYEASLRNGYFSGIKELYNSVIMENKGPKY